MSCAKIPRTISTLIQAIQKRDTSALLATFAKNAAIVDRGIEYRADDIRKWSDRFTRYTINIHPINTTRRHSNTIVTVVIKSAGNNVAQLDWTLSLVDEKIVALTITPSVLPELSSPVATYVLATNTFDLERLLDAFAEDAVVNDQLREYRGKSAIRNWAIRDIIENRMTMYVVNVVERHGTAIVAANVDGDFDKRGLPDPLVLAFYFTTHRDKIVQLIILRNEPDI